MRVIDSSQAKSFVCLTDKIQNWTVAGFLRRQKPRIKDRNERFVSILGASSWVIKISAVTTNESPVNENTRKLKPELCSVCYHCLIASREQTSQASHKLWAGAFMVIVPSELRDNLKNLQISKMIRLFSDNWLAQIFSSTSPLSDR